MTHTADHHPLPGIERRYDHLYGQELDRLIEREPIAWVPLGILERHGDHLPFGLDAFKAHGVCLFLAQRLGGVVLPPTHVAGVHEPWHRDPQRYREHRRQVRDFYLRPDTFRMLLEDVADGLSNIGFRIVVLYSGHYPKLQIDILRQVAQRTPTEGSARIVAFHEPDAMNGQGDHAGKCETSLHMALGGLVHLDRIRPEHAGTLGYFSSQLPPPTEASLQFGEQALASILEHFRTLLAPSGAAL